MCDRIDTVPKSFVGVSTFPSGFTEPCQTTVSFFFQATTPSAAPMSRFVSPALLVLVGVLRALLIWIRLALLFQWLHRIKFHSFVLFFWCFFFFLLPLSSRKKLWQECIFPLPQLNLMEWGAMYLLNENIQKHWKRRKSLIKSESHLHGESPQMDNQCMKWFFSIFGWTIHEIKCIVSFRRHEVYGRDKICCQCFCMHVRCVSLYPSSLVPKIENNICKTGNITSKCWQHLLFDVKINCIYSTFCQ